MLAWLSPQVVTVMELNLAIRRLVRSFWTYSELPFHFAQLLKKLLLALRLIPRIVQLVSLTCARSKQGDNMACPSPGRRTLDLIEGADAG